MVKESPLRHPRRDADLVDAGGGIALSTHRPMRRGDQLAAGVAARRLCRGGVSRRHAFLHTNQLVWRQLAWISGRKHRGRCRVDEIEEHTSELQSLMSISYAVLCLKKKKIQD